jgi:hypothetical protein
MRDTLPVRHLVPAMTESEALDLTNRPTFLARTDVDHIVTTSEVGRKPDGTPLYICIKNVIPYEYCAAAYPIALRIANAPITNRPIAAGAYMDPRTRKDGSKGNRSEVPDLPHLKGAKNGIAGFYSDRQSGTLACRLTSFATHDWQQFEEVLPLTRKVDEMFRTYCPERYAAQAEAKSRIDQRFVIPGTVFTTVTINLNFRTAAHLDEGDFHDGFGALTLLTAGEFSGGELAFPRYRIAVDYRMQDILLCDVHEVHGNLPIVGIPESYARLALVFYLRANMLQVCPAEALEPTATPPDEDEPLTPELNEPELEVAEFDNTIEGPAILGDAEPGDGKPETNAQASEHFTRAVAFGRDLIVSQDLDPVYVAFQRAGLDYDTRARILLTYTCVYHLGSSVAIGQKEGSDYWDALQVAAVNEGLYWPRASERRHWRGKQALETVRYLRDKYKYPEDVVGYWASGGNNSFSAVADRVKEIPRFGPWISFKVCDMLERCLGHSVDFSTCSMGVYKEPRAAAALILTGSEQAAITDSDLEGVMRKMLRPEHLGSLMAPPDSGRRVNVQEVETCLCKFKSHLHGNYPPGKDTQEVLHGLEDPRWDNPITRSMIKVIETLPYSRSTPAMAAKVRNDWSHHSRQAEVQSVDVPNQPFGVAG